MHIIFRTLTGTIKVGYYYLTDYKRWRETKKAKKLNTDFRIYDNNNTTNYYISDGVEIIAKSIREKDLKEKYPQYFI
jgi:hypothetical protein